METRKVPHYKDRYDPDAEYVVAKDMPPSLKAGDMVPNDWDREKVKRFLRSGYVVLSGGRDENYMQGRDDQTLASFDPDGKYIIVKALSKILKKGMEVPKDIAANKAKKLLASGHIKKVIDNEDTIEDEIEEIETEKFDASKRYVALENISTAIRKGDLITKDINPIKMQMLIDQKMATSEENVNVDEMDDFDAEFDADGEEEDEDEIKDDDPIEDDSEDTIEDDEEETLEVKNIVPGASGWYTVYFVDGTERKMRAKEIEDMGYEVPEAE